MYQCKCAVKQCQLSESDKRFGKELSGKNVKYVTE